tara:strand:- start:427 stop:528 length:102 start_codon:yes stop_codon:yes gene_type:complete
MKKILNVIISFFDKIDDNLREMYGIDNKKLGKK